jgi:diguanylate cyclase (GGDEF)-like protein
VAIRVAERIRDAIAATSFALDEAEVSVTVSVGAATARDAGIAFPAVLRAADEALYEAKNGGRNRTELRDAA